MSAPPVSVPVGWYPDPQTPHMVRWWDGTMWTHHVHPALSAPSAATAGPVVAGTHSDVERGEESPAIAWVRHNAIFGAMNGTAWVSVLAAWTALGASGGAAVAGAGALCLAVPIIGWFFGLPIVIGIGLAGAGIWAAGFVAILCAWAVTTVAVALFTYCYQRLKDRA
jgi:hypothetical protein